MPAPPTALRPPLPSVHPSWVPLPSGSRKKLRHSVIQRQYVTVTNFGVRRVTAARCGESLRSSNCPQTGWCRCAIRFAQMKRPVMSSNASLWRQWTTPREQNSDRGHGCQTSSKRNAGRTVKHEHIRTHCATTNFADNRYMVNQASSLDRDERRVVALEIRSVDDDSVDNSRCAPLYYDII